MSWFVLLWQEFVADIRYDVAIWNNTRCLATCDTHCFPVYFRFPRILVPTLLGCGFKGRLVRCGFVLDSHHPLSSHPLHHVCLPTAARTRLRSPRAASLPLTFIHLGSRARTAPNCWIDVRMWGGIDGGMCLGLALRRTDAPADEAHKWSSGRMMGVVGKNVAHRGRLGMGTRGGPN